jgi:MFS family permease
MLGLQAPKSTDTTLLAPAVAAVLLRACACCRQHAPEVLMAVLLQAFATSGLFVLTAWLPSYLMQATGMATSTALLVQTINMALLAGSMLLGGLLADKWAPTPVLLATCAVTIAFGWPAWLLFSMGVAEVTWFAQALLCVLVGLHWGALTEVTVELFPPGVSGLHSSCQL